MSELLLFRKWNLSEIEVNDQGLKSVISLNPVLIPTSMGRHEHKKFAKSEVNAVERLVNSLMHFGKKDAKNTGRMSGKKHKLINVVKAAFEIIYLRTNENPVKIFVQALENNDITIYGDGSQTRSFSYVDDTVGGIVALMESKEFDVFNIGNPNEMSINELSNVIIKLTDSKSKLIYKELPNDDPKQRKPDITKAKEKLNWEPKVDLETGLSLTIDWIKKELAK